TGRVIHSQITLVELSCIFFFFWLWVLLYVYIKKKKSWNEAQSFCREHHTDLAPVSNEQDNLKLGKLGNSNDYIWIGLKKNSSESQKWMWSGGREEMNYEAWDEEEKTACPHPKMDNAKYQEDTQVCYTQYRDVIQ
uniref:C-type lectin domain-containing protein n=1 Tax=Oreochromis niloticus TaxID=8128 RepID=A0A669D767_ORENI